MTTPLNGYDRSSFYLPSNQRMTYQKKKSNQRMKTPTKCGIRKYYFSWDKS